jgi:hypothetical protein
VEGGVKSLRDGVPAGVVAGAQEVGDVRHQRRQGHQVDPPKYGRQGNRGHDPDRPAPVSALRFLRLNAPLHVISEFIQNE